MPPSGAMLFVLIFVDFAFLGREIRIGPNLLFVLFVVFAVLGRKIRIESSDLCSELAAVPDDTAPPPSSRSLLQKRTSGTA